MTKRKSNQGLLAIKLKSTDNRQSYKLLVKGENQIYVTHKKIPSQDNTMILKCSGTMVLDMQEKLFPAQKSIYSFSQVIDYL